MKKYFIVFFLMTISLSLSAQDEKLRVAVFDPSSSGTAIDEGTKVAVREIISSAFVNTGKYIIVERSQLQQVMKEQKMTNTDAFDDSQATKLGKLAGANKVVLSVVTLVGGRNMLSIKVIDVKTATVDQQKTKVCQSNDLLDVVEPLTLELMGEKATYVNTASKQTAQSETVAQTNNGTNSGLTRPTPQEGEIGLYCEGIEIEPEPFNVIVLFDDQKIIATNIQNGFSISIKDNYVGKHIIQINKQKFKVDTGEKRIFVFKAKDTTSKQIIKTIAFGVLAPQSAKYEFSLEKK